jgi:hypothetical protein
MNDLNIGFMLIEADNGPLANKVFETVHKFTQMNPYGQNIIFTSKCEQIDNKTVPVLHLSHSKFFNGKLILTDIASLLITKNFTNYTNKYFYALDVPWLNNPKANYKQWSGLFNDPNLDIIAGDNDLYNIYDICWKKPLGIAENFDEEKLYSIIH